MMLFRSVFHGSHFIFDGSIGTQKFSDSFCHEKHDMKPWCIAYNNEAVYADLKTCFSASSFSSVPITQIRPVKSGSHGRISVSSGTISNSIHSPFSPSTMPFARRTMPNSVVMESIRRISFSSAWSNLCTVSVPQLSKISSAWWWSCPW